jgi:hypothetical protein
MDTYYPNITTNRPLFVLHWQCGRLRKHDSGRRRRPKRNRPHLHPTSVTSQTLKLQRRTVVLPRCDGVGVAEPPVGPSVSTATSARRARSVGGVACGVGCVPLATDARRGASSPCTDRKAAARAAAVATAVGTVDRAPGADGGVGSTALGRPIGAMGAPAPKRGKSSMDRRPGCCCCCDGGGGGGCCARDSTLGWARSVAETADCGVVGRTSGCG